jgi:hypothetical protein
MLINVGLDLRRDENSCNFNALLQGCRELTLDEVTTIAGGIDWGGGFIAWELWGGSVAYSKGAGDFVGMDDVSTRTCHHLPN